MKTGLFDRVEVIDHLASPEYQKYLVWRDNILAEIEQNRKDKKMK